MKKNWWIIFVVILLVSALYFIELSKVDTKSVGSMPSLDNINSDENDKNWDLFYKVRATIIDGQTADFSIPHKLQALVGKEMKLSGAAVFFGNGCEMINDSTTSVHSFFLLPTLGLAQSCVLLPDEAMRWTIMVKLSEPWILSRNEMINAEAIVVGKFEIETSKPYESAFYIERASAKLK